MYTDLQIQEVFNLLETSDAGLKTEEVLKRQEKGWRNFHVSSTFCIFKGDLILYGYN